MKRFQGKKAHVVTLFVALLSVVALGFLMVSCVPEFVESEEEIDSRWVWERKGDIPDGIAFDMNRNPEGVILIFRGKAERILEDGDSHRILSMGLTIKAEKRDEAWNVKIDDTLVGVFRHI